MQTRLSRICDAVIEAGWLAALVVTPLFFNTYTNRVFEPDKLHLLRSIALIMAVAWLIQLLDAGLRPGAQGSRDGAATGRATWHAIKSTPLVLPTLLLVAAYLLSTVLSIVPRISLLGSYVRMQGTFSFLSYVVIFAMVLTHLRTRVQVNRLVHTIILTSLPISIYGLVQHYGQDPLPWGGDVKARVAANMGNAIFVAAYLIMAFFLTLERLVHSLAATLSVEKGGTADVLRAAGYLFILAVQTLTIVFTLSRGPWLGLAAGLYMFGLLGVLLLGRWAVGQPRAPHWLGRAIKPVWLGLIGLTAIGVVFLVVLNIPQGPLQSLRQQRYLGRMGTVFNITEGTNAVRVLIWEGVVDMMFEPHDPIQFPDGTTDALNPVRLLVGYGPESMWVAYNKFYPPDLAHFEQRNASPDRSHNETFDAVVRTGLLGLAAQLLLFGSIFYYALRWLGLIQGHGRRNLFLALFIGGGALGVIVPVVLDHSLRLAGIVLPAGMILGVIVYVALDLLLTPATKAGAQEPGSERTTTGERELLILAIFSALVAHFVEIHTGISIASTLTHFWVLSAVLVVAGMGWLDQPEGAEIAAVLPVRETQQQTRTQPATASKKAARGKRTGGREIAVQRAPGLAAGSRQMARGEVSSVQAFLPYAGIAVLVTLVLVWDYLVNQGGSTNAFAVLWDAFTTKIDQASRLAVRSPMLLVLMLFTWLVGGMIALAEVFHLRPHDTRFRWATNAGLYASAVAGTFLVYGLIHGSRSILVGLTGMDVFRRIAGHIVVFDVALFAGMLGLAGAIRLADHRPRPICWFNGTPLLSLAGGAAAAGVALVIILNANIRTVQADTYYKQGLAFEGAGSWESAVVLYNEAAHLEPNEDYYYLFLGRAMLEFASNSEAGAGTLPADLSAVPTEDLLSLAETGVRAGTREDAFRATHAVLVGAQRLNPLNTDHSANLARLFRSWAFADALKTGDVPTNAFLRQLAQTEAEGVDLEKLDQALGHYQVATRLSPQNAQLWNEMAAVQYIQGNLQDALASLDRSLELDQKFYQTHLLRADMLAEAGDKNAALASYRQALALRPGDISILNAVGVYAAQTGDASGAVEAFDKVISQEGTALSGAESQLASLDANAQQAGGYDKLGEAATSRRNVLQNQVTSHRSQLHLAYRNKALVLRDAGRVAEALQAAKAALENATDAQRPTVEQLINELQSRASG